MDGKMLSGDFELKDILKKKNVIGLGMGTKEVNGQDTGKGCITVMVEEKVKEEELSSKDIVPEKIAGIQTDVIAVGEVKALEDRAGTSESQDLASRKEKMRPAKCGISEGHYQITAGTQGAMVKLVNDNKKYILSNCHVLANSGDCEKGDAILQPGPYDSGTREDKIAELVDWSDIKFFNPEDCNLSNGIVKGLNWISEKLGRSHRFNTYKTYDDKPTNLTDAAIAKPLDKNLVFPTQYEIGRVNGMDLDPKVKMNVQKSGRTSGVTQGKVKLVGGVVQVKYGNKTALFSDQLITTKMVSPGDSGSLLMDMDNKAVGLVFAGSEKASIANNLDNVVRQFNIEEVL